MFSFSTLPFSFFFQNFSTSSRPTFFDLSLSLSKKKKKNFFPQQGMNGPPPKGLPWPPTAAPAAAGPRRCGRWRAGGGPWGGGRSGLVGEESFFFFF